METITMDEFKALVPIDSPDREEAFGLFAISEKGHKNQCENLKVGDTVFYLDSNEAGVSEVAPLQVDLTIIQATVVDGYVTFEGVKLPVRNELEN